MLVGDVKCRVGIMIAIWVKGHGLGEKIRPTIWR